MTTDLEHTSLQAAVLRDKRTGIWFGIGCLFLLGAGCGSGPEAQAAEPAGRMSAEYGIHGEPAVIFGCAIEASTGLPVAGATIVSPDGQRMETDALGRFELSGVAPGTTGVLEASTREGLWGENQLRPVTGGRLEVVIYLR